MSDNYSDDARIADDRFAFRHRMHSTAGWLAAPSRFVALYFGQQPRQRRAQCSRQLLDGEDRRHPLAALEQTDVVAVEARLLGKSFL